MNKSHRLYTLLAMLLVVALCLSIVPVITLAAQNTRTNDEIPFSSETGNGPAQEEEGDIHIPIGSLPTQPTQPSQPTEPETEPTEPETQPTEPESVPGDVSGDDALSNDDVIALMWHILFPDENPINGNGDLNKDGKLSNDDVITLMWHILFPDENPLP